MGLVIRLLEKNIGICDMGWDVLVIKEVIF